MTSNNNSNDIISKPMANDSGSGSSSLSDIIPFDYTLKGKRMKKMEYTPHHLRNING
jgi:hypothetical protein